MRFLLDTNVLIPLEDSKVFLEPALASFVHFANEYGHQLAYHPASERDIARDNDTIRQGQTLARLAQYIRLDGTGSCPWNDSQTSENDSADNEILYALHQNAAHFLVTEDIAIHRKARTQKLESLVLTIQEALDILRRLHEKTSVQLPNITDVPLHALTPQLEGPFFDSLREGYNIFNKWFVDKAKGGRRAWACFAEDGALKGLCIYAIQQPEEVAGEGMTLDGPALKLCTFKIGDTDRGQKIGELLLKTSFSYASQNRLGTIFLHVNAIKHPRLIELLEDLGFKAAGQYRSDTILVKEHPVLAPEMPLDPVDYLRRFYPHYQSAPGIRKFIIPIIPAYHEIIFPDYHRKGDHPPIVDMTGGNTAGNAIKLAYLCRAGSNKIRPGDIVAFYRSHDHKEVTTLGVVERVETLSDPEAIVGLVKRRTVYSYDEIATMAQKPTKVILFRVVHHLAKPIRLKHMLQRGILNGHPQSITEITHAKYKKLMDATIA